ncbi:MAG: hypothetical protein IJ730_03970, partial [Alphaproteobacteria bacterium]|nr:hypothetical protein [Alphaproteobacteria bacterium]
KKSIEDGKKIQLIIESWIAQNNGFEIQKNNVSSLQYWFLKRKCEKVVITSDVQSTKQLTETIIDNVKNLLFQYNIECIPFYVNFSDKYNENYMHLARVKEWLNDR